MRTDPVGQTLLVAALVAATASAVTAAIPALRGRTWSTRSLVVATAMLWGAVLALARAAVALDTRFAYVVAQTRNDLSLPLRISSLWAGAEGSLLLFAAMVTTALVVGHRRAPAWQQVGTGVVVTGLVAAMLGAANPFTVLDLPPLSGAGMAPILEHWAMVIHPPLLYAGMSLALIPATARDPRQAHRWGLASMTVLTLALGLGSAWAYVELGWGGWWAWDPIENVALIVWLLLAAGLHWRPLDSAALSGTGAMNLTVIHALCWPAVLGGAAMTRTSLRTSVHAFADAAGLSVWLWPLATVAALGAGLRVWESRRLLSAPPPPDPGEPLGSPRIAMAPVFLLLLTAFVVAAGTYRPFIGGDGTAGWFYSRSLYPVAVVGAVAIGLVPLLRRAGLLTVPTAAAAALAAVAAAAIAPLVGWDAWWQVVLAAALSSGVVLVVAPAAVSGLGATGIAAGRGARLAGHLGILLVVIAALAGTGSAEWQTRLQVGDETTLGDHRFQLVALNLIEDEDRGGRFSDEPVRAEAVVVVDDTRTLTPSVTVFPERNLRLPEVATHSRPWLDTQVTLRDVDAEAGALFTVGFRPWNQLVWWGVGLLMLATVLGLISGAHASPATAPPSTSASRPDRRGRGAGPAPTGSTASGR